MPFSDHAVHVQLDVADVRDLAVPGSRVTSGQNSSAPSKQRWQSSGRPSVPIALSTVDVVVVGRDLQLLERTPPGRSTTPAVQESAASGTRFGFEPASCCGLS